MKLFFIQLIIIIYSLIYKLFLYNYGQLVVYIINPLIWLAITIITYIILPPSKEKRASYLNDTIIALTIISLLYDIIYYSFGIIAGYTNNPYSTTISGIVINIFSLWFVIATKEYTRYVLAKRNVTKHRFLYFFSLFIVFFISDLNIISILNTNNLIILWSKEMMIPLITNLLMLYIAYYTDYKNLLIIRGIIVLPTLIFNAVPDYEWLTIMLFNLSFSFLTYFILQYIINKHQQNDAVHVFKHFHLKKWIFNTAIIFVVLSFGLGLFSVKPTVILSGSMEPNIKPGDMVIIQKIDIEEVVIGDIIEYQLPDFNVVHRIISIEYQNGERYFVTKGDANLNPDKLPVRESQIIGKVILNIPYVGYPTYLIKNMVDNNEKIDIEQGGANNE